MSLYQTREESKDAILALVPKTCAACGAPLVLSKDMMHLTCTNPECSGKLYRRLEIMAKAFGIENIGVTVAEELVNNCGLTELYQLYDLTIEDILKVPRYKIGMATKLYNSIHKVTKVTWQQFIRGIQIPRIGAGTSKYMAKSYDSLEALLNTSVEEMFKVCRQNAWAIQFTREGVTPIVEAIHEMVPQVLKLAEKVTIEYPEKEQVTNVAQSAQPKRNITAVVTGSLKFGKRPDFQAKYGEAYGVRWGSAVSGNTDILVTNDTKPTGKYKTALDLQAAGGKIQIMTEEEFLKYLGE